MPTRDLLHVDADGLLDELLRSGTRAGLVHLDPPWTYTSTGATSTGSAASHYGGLAVEQIAAHLRRCSELVEGDCYAVVWCTWPLLAEWMAADVGRWRYVTGGSWHKTGGRPGIGYHWRGNSEPILVYRIGRPKPVTSEPISNALASERGAHSAKPIGHLAQIFRAWCRPGRPVVDLYAGLATAASACEIAGLDYVGAEPDPGRYAAARDRLAQAWIPWGSR